MPRCQTYDVALCDTLKGSGYSVSFQAIKKPQHVCQGVCDIPGGVSVWGDRQASDPGGSSIKYIKPGYNILNKYNYKGVHVLSCVLGSVCFKG